MSRIVFQNSYIVIIPSYQKTDMHKHPMLHIFWGDDICKVTADNKEFSGKVILLKSDIKHIVQEKNGCRFFLLIDPTSDIAEQLQERYLQGDFFAKCVDVGRDMFCDLENSNDEEIIQFAEKLLTELGINKSRYITKDERVDQVIANIISGEWLSYSIKRIAESVFLSESRLTHLFKEEAGISLKSYILIRKMERAYKFVNEGGKNTQAAQEAGFASSAHLAYTCKKLTGISITDVLKNR